MSKSNTVLKFIGENDQGEIASVSDIPFDPSKCNLPSPGNATVRYASRDYDIFFETSVKSEKYHNFRKNPQGTFVITPEFARRTLQLKGFVNELTGQEANEALDHLIEQFGRSRRFFSPVTRFVHFKPIWYRYTNGEGKRLYVREGIILA